MRTPLICISAVMLAGSMAHAQEAPTPATLRWSRFFNAIPDTVGVGNHGTLAWLGLSLNNERLALLAPTETSPPVAIYEDTSSVGYRVEVAAADRSPACAVVWRNPITQTGEIRYYDGFSVSPQTIMGPNRMEEVRISDDGARVAVGYNDDTFQAAVNVYDETLALLTSMVAVVPSTGYVEHHLSADGSRVLLATQNTDYLFDVASGDLLHQNPHFSTFVTNNHALDGDGHTWVEGNSDVGIWRENSGAFTKILTFADPALAGSVDQYTACGISRDGSTVVATGNVQGRPGHLRVYCWALSPAGATLLWTHVRNAPSTLPDWGQEVSLSDNGRWIAVGTLGTVPSLYPEVIVFDRDSGNVPIASIDTFASCTSVDISGNGRFVLAGAMQNHAFIGSSFGYAYCLDLGRQGLWLSGTPSIGRAATLHIQGDLGDPVWMAASLHLLPVGVPIAGFSGSWWLDLMQPTLLPPTFFGTVSASGRLSVPFTLPLDPALVGLEIFVQSARLGSANAIDNHLRLPITP